MVLAVSHKVKTTIPLQAEAEAIAWASRIAVNLEVDQIYIESDSKTCMDHIRGAVQNFPWRISRLLVDLLALAATHPCWSFA